MTGRSKKKTKKVKKKKKSNEEKLEKEVEKMRSNEELVESIVYRVNRWLAVNSNSVTELFSSYDTDDEGLVTYKQFKAGMTDLKIPCNSAELHLITLLLDKNFTQTISYVNLTKQISTNGSGEEYNCKGYCSLCGKGMDDPNINRKLVPRKRYVLLDLRLASFSQLKEPFINFFLVVSSDTYISQIIHKILAHTAICTTKMALFRQKTCTKSSLLPEQTTLEECAYHGYCKQHPQEVALFYDFCEDFTDCPLLMADYYFTKNYT
ncbi:uncharacterized protein LOC115221079 [Octopus sinensis]|uniref:Uncharacterized protein LOC115221079 n=1 Tax=Octopus sinensis TaxID=2607531 RepID=A0A6P7T893_9MOLL|nr:uncharacterized protein LOC115221079 [Octopus sinensis]